MPHDQFHIPSATRRSGESEFGRTESSDDFKLGRREVGFGGGPTGVQWHRFPSDPRYETVFREDFITAPTTTYATVGASVVYTTAAGGGAGTVAQINSEVGRIGILRLGTGGLTNGDARAIVCTNGTPSAGTGIGGLVLLQGGSPGRVVFIVRVSAAPASGQDFSATIGLRDVITGTSQDQATFNFNFAANGSNVRTATNVAGAGAVVVNSGVAGIFGQFVEYAIESDGNGSGLRFLMNGKLVDHRPGVLPTVPMAAVFLLGKTSGTNTINMDVDSVSIWQSSPLY